MLEHIEDDLGALQTLHAILKPGGKIAIFVPACAVLYSHMDVSLGHYRRYSMRELNAKLTQAGFTVQRCYYMDSIGFFAWLAMKWQAILTKNPSSGSERSLTFYDRYLYPLSRALDRLGLRHLFGKNIMIFAIKP